LAMPTVDGKHEGKLDEALEASGEQDNFQKRSFGAASQMFEAERADHWSVAQHRIADIVEHPYLDT